MPSDELALPALPVLWHEGECIAIHKPAGWLVHRTGLGVRLAALPLSAADRRGRRKLALDSACLPLRAFRLRDGESGERRRRRSCAAAADEWCRCCVWAAG